MEIRHHRIAHREIVGREDKLVGPTLESHQMTVHADGARQSAEHRRTHRADTMVLVFSLVDDIHQILAHIHLLRIHAMLRKILHINLAVISAARMESKKPAFYTFDLQTLHQFAAEMHTGCRSHNGPLVLGEDALVAFLVPVFHRAGDIFRKRSLAQGIEGLLEFIVVAVVKEAERTSAVGRIVDHLGHHRIVVAEIELVADTDLAGRLHEHVPETVFLIKLPKEKHFDAGARLLLVAIETGRKNLGVVENHHVAFIEEIDDLLEDMMGDLACAGVDHHQATFVTILRRTLGHQLLGKLELELRKFHKFALCSYAAHVRRLNLCLKLTDAYPLPGQWHPCGKFWDSGKQLSFRSIVGEDHLGFRYPLESLVDRQTRTDLDISYAGAAQSRQMRPCAERLPYVAGKSPDISSFAADHPHRDLPVVKTEKFECGNLQRFGFQFHLLSLARQIIGPLSVDLHGGKDRRHLHHPSREPGQHVEHHLLRHVFPWVGGVDLRLQVEARSGGADSDLGHILLSARLQGFDAPGGAPRADDKHSGGQRIESARMPHLEFLHLQTPLDRAAKPLHRVKRRPAKRFVDGDHLAPHEIHRRIGGMRCFRTACGLFVIDIFVHSDSSG